MLRNHLHLSCSLLRLKLCKFLLLGDLNIDFNFYFQPALEAF